MCGIAGLANSTGEVPQLESIQRMCDAIVHRGPDDEGFYLAPYIGLGMRRLSIIDLTTGHQPIHNENKTVWVVYNGEIYNFAELRPKLEAKSHKFYTNTDTEVIVHLYEDHGADFVKYLRGMFAIALYDVERRKLILARDRLGKKPLYYAHVGQELLFGSEIKALVALRPELAEVDRAALVQYFSLGYILDPDSAFEPIKKLPPGHLLEFCGPEVRISKYWDLPAYGTEACESENELLDQLRSVLSDAVRLRMVSDVPLGALLSGGVDSSTVVALMAEASARPVKTFSIAFKSADFDESRFARAVAERFGTDHNELVVQPNMNEDLHELTAFMEEPFADSSMLPTFYVSRMARQHVTVALSGDGGDEIFAGYDRYDIHLRRKRSETLARLAGPFFRKGIFPLLPAGLYARRLLFNALLGKRERYIDSMSLLPIKDREQQLFSADFIAESASYADPKETLLACMAEAEGTPDDLASLQYLDTKTYLPGDILTKVDRMSMANSLEMRAPLLDHVVVEWATRLPSKWKLRGREGKYILKRLAERLQIPTEVLYRPKQGFAMPLVHWFRNQLRQEIWEILLEPKTIQRGFFNKNALETMLHEHASHRRDHSSQIWLLLILELWHRNFLENRQRNNRFSFTRQAGMPIRSLASVPAPVIA